MRQGLDHIAVVGCGFTGTSALHQIVERKVCRRVTVFEASGDYGPGYAYNPAENENYLLNNTTDSLCLAPTNRRAFIDWLAEKKIPGVDLSPKGNVSRTLYGLFLRESVQAATRKAREIGMDVQFITAEITKVEDNSDGVELAWQDGSITADCAIMATGRCPDVDILSPSAHGAPALYINSHIDCRALDDIALDETVHILGASLSAYDIVNRLFAPETGCHFTRCENGELKFEPGPNKRQIVLASRSGRLKKMQSANPKAVPTSTFDALIAKALDRGEALSLSQVAYAIWGHTSIDEKGNDVSELLSPYANCSSVSDSDKKAVSILSKDIRQAKSTDGQNKLVDFFEQEQTRIADLFAKRLLRPEEEMAYRKRYETAVLSYAAPCPIETAERLLALLNTGAATLLIDVGTPKLSADGSVYELPHRFGVEKAKTIINATGKVDRDVCSKRQPKWVQHMANAGHLKPYKILDTEMPDADIDMKSFRPPGSKSIFFANMLLWGPWFVTSSAFTMATIISRILDQIADNPNCKSQRVKT